MITLPKNLPPIQPVDKTEIVRAFTRLRAEQD